MLVGGVRANEALMRSCAEIPPTDLAPPPVESKKVDWVI